MVKKNDLERILNGETFVYVDFPDNQLLMDLDGYDDNCVPADDGGCIASCSWLKEQIEKAE